jgi:hypothetical protein
MDKVYVRSDFTLIGEMCYEPGKGLGDAGIRMYQGVDPNDKSYEFLCVEDAETLEEAGVLPET